MTTTEIVDVIHEHYQPDWEKKKLMTSVSATISAALETIYTKNENKVSLI